MTTSPSVYTESNLAIKTMREPTIVYEDEQVLVIDKPIGMLVHADDAASAETVVDWFLRRVPTARGVGEPQTNARGELIERSGIVHRLDRETSGILILAKTQAAYDHLKVQFHDRHAEKEYHTIVYGFMKTINGHINTPIGRSKKDPRIRSAFRTASGNLRDAVTDWELITQNASYAYLRILPKTGRTHQIRAHLTSVQHPIVGDSLYASEAQIAATHELTSRLMLHAFALTLELPGGKQQRFTAPLPSEFVTFQNLIKTTRAASAE